MSLRNRREAKALSHYYKSLPANHVCEFCSFTADNEDILENNQYFMVVRNRFPYSYWDNQGVSDHLMVVPKQHTDTLADLSNEGAVEFVKLISKYEKRGYSVNARPPGHRMKSIVHQHTHLIKDNGQQRKFLFFIYKPYTRVVR